jgi:hypothetical protein
MTNAVRWTRARKLQLLTALVIFTAAEIVFPRYLPDTPAFGYTHFAIIALSGAYAVWLILGKAR